MLDVGCGSRHTVCLTEGNQVWSFGWNKYGQLGLGDNKSRDHVSKVPLPKFTHRYYCVVILSSLYNYIQSKAFTGLG